MACDTKGFVSEALDGYAAAESWRTRLRPRASKPLKPTVVKKRQEKKRVRFNVVVQVADALPNYEKSNKTRLSFVERREIRKEVNQYKSEEMLVYPAICPPQCQGNPLPKKRRHVWFADQVIAKPAKKVTEVNVQTTRLKGLFDKSRQTEIENKRAEEQAEAERVAMCEVFKQLDKFFAVFAPK